ncbi:MAG: MarR family transcriptional regulator [Firmicutes bacterium]|nr:MarR family transcriptional regulator [Bacillota bacterium]
MNSEEFSELDHHWQTVQRYLRTRTRRGIREQIGAGIEVAGFQILGQLVRRGPLAPSDLASCFDVRSSTMTSQLDRLEEAGLVLREPVPDGGSRIKVMATPKGVEAYERYRRLRREILQDLLGHLSADDQQRLADLYQRLADGIEAEREKARRAGE